jgi:hypothetical protein
MRRVMMTRSGVIGILVSLLGIAGCGGGYQPPSSDTARAALERSLTAWKDGGRPGAISGGDSPIQAADAAWLGGQKIESFEILSEDSSGDEKTFRVRLVPPGGGTPKEVRYVVFGTDPIFVYAEDDFHRLVNMDDNPVPTKSTRAKGRRRD